MLLLTLKGHALVTFSFVLRRQLRRGLGELEFMR